MIRSLRTGVSGLKTNQVRMDVVGNNIANVNTVAFKRSRAAFGEMLGQQLLGVGRTAGGTGINPAHVGLGVSVASIDQNWTQGALENTSVSTDLALNGSGFFIARAGEQNLLTRAGNFTFNRNGELVTANGLNVQGWSFSNDGVLVTGALSDIRVDFNAQAPAKRTENVVVGGNLSAGSKLNDTTTISGVVFDSRGVSRTVLIEFERTAVLGEGTPAATADEWTFNVKDADGNVISGGTAPKITFTPNGEIASIDGTAIPANPTAADYSFSFDWDIDGDGSPAGGETFSIVFGNERGGALTQYAGSNTSTVREQDGTTSGTIAAYSINPDGILEVTFTNGEQKKLFQVAIGSVNNPNGLEQQGENFYTTTSASGDLQLGRAGKDVRTAVVAGTLEMSNVDLATEFTEMIVAQRGYQASARVITTSDELMQETVQLKR